MITWEDYLENIPDDKWEKYAGGGIYSISINEKLVYIGKSMDMLKRIASHLWSIDWDRKGNKYKVLRETLSRGIKVSFDVIEYCNDEEKLGELEGKYIR